MISMIDEVNTTYEGLNVIDLENLPQYPSDALLLSTEKEFNKDNWGNYPYKIPPQQDATTDATDRTQNYVPPISTYSDPYWLVEAKMNLQKILQLGDNWDGYGSPSISEQLVQHASKFLSCLENENIPTPFIGPISGGGIQLEWHIDNRELEIEFIENNTIGFLKVHEDGSLEEGEFHINDFNKARQIIQWLMIGQ